MEAKELNNSHAIVRSYDYDKRGNQTSEYVDGLLNKTFTFDAANMLSKVVDSEKGELENQYNGLGFRVATTRPEEKIEYLCDLSRDYYNLLERTVNGETESFIYDNNVVSMSKAGNSYYYLQDELGSPMYMTGTDGAAVSSYAFDDFGRNIDPFTGKIKKAGNKQSGNHAYTTEGNIIQPFAFTGYQEDEVSGLMFAQARHYDATSGRFQSEDRVKGFKNSPHTLNHYSYCFGSPVGFVDRNGNWPDWVTDAWDKACDVANDVKDAACDVWNNYIYGTEETVSYSSTTTYADGIGGASQTVSHQETIHDDGDRLFKVSTNTDLDTGEVSKSFSINLKAFFGGSDHETGGSAKVSVGVSSKGTFSASASAKVSVDGAHVDGSASASVGVEKVATADAHVGAGYKENTVGLGVAVNGLRLEDTIGIYGYHNVTKDGTSVTTKANLYVRTAAVYVVAGVAYAVYSGDTSLFEQALQKCGF